MGMTLLAGAASLSAAEGLTIEHLGINTTLVRVNGDGRYILLPVQESSVDTPVKIIINGKVADQFNARIAKSKVDYFVPVDLAPYKGEKVNLLVQTQQDRSSLREVRDDAIWQEIALSDTYDTTNREIYRPVYHHTPRWGWMNDPNGMFYKDGLWHLYYQWNPYGSKWQNLSWGHSSSPDLVHWTDEGLALAPDGLGMIFSGSSTVDTANTAGFGEGAVVALYTSADATQQQSLAFSTDNGKHFTIYEGNPILTQDTEARDPNMFWHAPSGKWILLLAHALDREMQIFSSPDLKTWTLESAFGKGLGEQEGVWECPDLFELPVGENGETKWVLVCNINPGGPFGGSAAQYFVGDFDGTTFTPDTDAAGNVPTKWMDFGKDHYATVSWSNAPEGRRTLIGWMSNWQYAADVPTMQFRSANTLPREAELFKASDGQYYLASVPSPELLSLRDRAVTNVKSASVGRKPSAYNLPKTNDGVCEISMTLAPKAGSKITLTLANQKGEKVVMVYDPEAHTFSFDRNESGLTDFSREFPAVTVSPTFSDASEISLRIFIDRSSIEVFGDGGRFCQTNLVFPTEPYTTLGISATAGGKVSNLAIYSIKAD